MNTRILAAIAITAATLTPAAIGTADQPANHTIPACNPALPNIYANWQADTYTDDGGHTTGWAATLTCNPSPPQVIHIKNMPGAMSLANAHTWCVDQGGTHVQTRFGANVYTCVNITDY